MCVGGGIRYCTLVDDRDIVLSDKQFIFSIGYY